MANDIADDKHFCRIEYELKWIKNNQRRIKNEMQTWYRYHFTTN